MNIVSVCTELFKILIKKSTTEKINEITNFMYNSNVIYEVCRLSDIFCYYDFIEIDDKISGIYKNLTFTIF